MWTSIATLRENLSQITLDVHDVADELLVSESLTGEDSPASSDRRISGRFAQSISSPRFPVPNGVDFASTSEMEHCKSEIQRLKESEGKFQELLNNYATILKEKEAQLSKLHKENLLLKKHLEAANVVEDLSSAETRSRPKELIDALEEKTYAFQMAQINYESKLSQLREQLDTQGRIQEDLRLKLQVEHDINDSFQKELQNLREIKEKNSLEMDILRKTLQENLQEITRLQAKRTQEELNGGNKKLESVISSLVEENGNLKKEKDKLSASLELLKKRLVEKSDANKSDADRGATSLNEVVQSSKLSEKEDTMFSLDQLARNLKEVCQERDKALQQLSRLKQHLLEKELEESEKMDEDSKIIEELHAKTEQQRLQISYLERDIKQAVSSQEQLKKAKEDERLKANEIISDLRNKLCSCMNTVDAKNVELLNLQTVLGQLYAENEAKERMERDLVHTKEDLIKLSDSLKVATQRLEVSKKEQEGILFKLSESERTLLEGKYRIQKLEEDNIKLRHALEQSMTRINRMTSDSDYFVDRRIVIKLLVVYFQRNHSREVLDLMVRMLGFSDEDKQRIGLAQKVAGKGVVRGVLGLPSRLVGGIFGANSEVSSHLPSDSQSFADLWVDFLLKETEEKERRENLETTGASLEKTPNSTRTWSENIQPANHIGAYSVSSREPNLEAEFSNVPLGSSVPSYNTTPLSRFLP